LVFTRTKHGARKKHIKDQGGKDADEKFTHRRRKKKNQQVVRKVQLNLLQVMASTSSFLVSPIKNKDFGKMNLCTVKER